MFSSSSEGSIHTPGFGNHFNSRLFVKSISYEIHIDFSQILIPANDTINITLHVEHLLYSEYENLKIMGQNYALKDYKEPFTLSWPVQKCKPCSSYVDCALINCIPNPKSCAWCIDYEDISIKYSREGFIFYSLFSYIIV